jgi:hypothetical protein
MPPMIGAEQLFIDEEPPSRFKLLARALLALMVGLILLFFSFDNRKKDQRDRQRQPVTCTIRTSTAQRSAATSKAPYIFNAHIDYVFRARPYSARETRSSADAAEIFALARTYAPQASAICWVHPQQPADAKLQAPKAHSADFFGVLAVASLFCLYGVKELIRSIHPPTAQTWRKRTQRRGLTFLVVLMIIGAIAALIWFFALPTIRALKATRWTRVECEIVSVALISEKQPGEIRFTTWKPDILYRYKIADAVYHSNDFRATELPSPWFYGKRNIIRRYAPGMKTVCYVNPADPADSVLIRTISPTLGFAIWPIALIWIFILGMQEWRHEANLPPAQVEQWKKTRDPRLGRLWLLLATATAAVMFIFFITDVVRDWRLRTTTPTELIITLITGLVAAALAYFSGRLGLRPKPPSPPASETD